MKKIATGLILLMVLAVISVYAEDNSTTNVERMDNSKIKAERMINLCEKAQGKLGSILDRIENKEAEKLFNDASKELEKAQSFYEKEQYDKAIENCLDAMHKFRECAALIREGTSERAKERIEGQIERIGSYISKIKERTENEAVIALLNDAESHLDAARTYLENGEIRKAESEIQKAINILRNLKEAWENGYQEKIKQRLEKLNETAKRRIQFYEQALDTLRDEGYDVQDLERDLEKIKNDLGDITSLINEGKYKEALPEIRELCREMQEFQENLRRIRNES